MFHQLLTPIGNALLPSFIVAALPIIIVLVLLGWARRPAWQASLAGLVVGLLIAIGVPNPEIPSNSAPNENPITTSTMRRSFGRLSIIHMRNAAKRPEYCAML